MIHAYAAKEQGAVLTPFEYDPGALAPGDVEVRVESCGICHSDLSMIDNEWRNSTYPLVAGHEVIGIVEKTGEGVSNLHEGQRVGLGWQSGACMTCRECISGDHNLCAATESTVVGRHGGFADRVRAGAGFAVPLPDDLDPVVSGPLFCGGITVFSPMVQFDVKPTDKVGVVGIGGLGHLAIQFLDHWGCEVTAFSTRSDKEDEARNLGADHFVNSRDPGALESLVSSLDFIIVTVNVALDWGAYISALRPKGRLHFVGAVLEPVAVQAFQLIGGQRSISGSPIGSPAVIARMLEFAAQHRIAPMTEVYPMAEVNAALDRLRSGDARYRVVLQA